MEYLSTGASTKAKFERVQAVVERVGKFKVESLDSRREASLIGFTFKLLDAEGRWLLQDFIKTLEISLASKTKQLKKVRVKPRLASRDISKQYDHSIEGLLPKVWSSLPQELPQKSKTDNWQSLTSDCQRFLTGRVLNKNIKKQQQKHPSISKTW